MKLILATKNAHKVQEFSRILEPLGIEAVSQTEMGIEDQAEETGSSFAENSYLKAKGLFDRTGMAVIADDSGGRFRRRPWDLFSAVRRPWLDRCRAYSPALKGNGIRPRRGAGRAVRLCDYPDRIGRASLLYRG